MREFMRRPECHQLHWSQVIGRVLCQAQSRLTREEMEMLIGAGAALKDAFLSRPAREARR